jgi:uncharacterized protein YecE (DUF72 family)
MARHWVGTSGWSYQTWRGLVYPRGLKPVDWLAHYARRLATVELNASFYRLPQERAVAAWAERTPEGFLFAVKAWRAITHMRRLQGCEDLLERFFARMAGLGGKAGPALFQLPPHFAADLGRLEGFLAGLPQGRRYVFEFRDPSWHDPAVYDLLRRANAAFCPFEMGPRRAPRVATADFVYVRLHGRKSGYRGNYSAAALADWAGWLKAQLSEGRDAYVYFDNTDEADFAVRNAEALDRLLRNGQARSRVTE